MGRGAQLRAGFLDRVLAGLDWLGARRAPAQAAHLVTGLEGEEAARSYLHRKGYAIVARRWSGGNLPGDLDLIAWKGPLLCFFEVKTRTAHDMAPAETAIDFHKQNILRRLARQYMRQLPNKSTPQARFDVVSVYLVPGQKREITHFENAFGWSEARREERI